jgi:uncharacterized membrane protein YkgB
MHGDRTRRPETVRHAAAAANGFVRMVNGLGILVILVRLLILIRLVGRRALPDRQGYASYVQLRSLNFGIQGSRM